MARILVVECVELCSRGIISALAEHKLTVASDDTSFGGVDLAIVSTSEPTMRRWSQITDELGDTPTVFIVQDHEWPALRVLMHGLDVRGLVHLHSPAQTLARSVDAVLTGGTAFDPACRTCANEVRRAWLGELGATKREVQVLGRVARGLTNASIAREIGCSERTVKFHVSNLLRKANVHSRRELRETVGRMDLRLGLAGVPME